MDARKGGRRSLRSLPVWTSCLAGDSPGQRRPRAPWASVGRAGAALLALILAAAPRAGAQVEVGGRLGVTRANVFNVKCPGPCYSTGLAASQPTDRLGVTAGGYVQWQAENGRAFRAEALRVTRGNESVHSVYLELPLLVEWSAPLHPRISLRGNVGVAPSLRVACTEYLRERSGRLRADPCEEGRPYPHNRSNALPPARDLGLQLGTALWFPVEGGGFALELRFSRGMHREDAVHEALTLSLSHGQTLRPRSGP